MLDTARFTYFVAEALAVEVGTVDADARLARRHDGPGPVPRAPSTAGRSPT
jgi:hypothetical protein